MKKYYIGEDNIIRSEILNKTIKFMRRPNPECYKLDEGEKIFASYMIELVFKCGDNKVPSNLRNIVRSFVTIYGEKSADEDLLQNYLHRLNIDSIKEIEILNITKKYIDDWIFGARHSKGESTGAAETIFSISNKEENISL